MRHTTSERMTSTANDAISLVFITDCWGYTRGGINVFNVDLCSAAAEIFRRDSVQIMCAVPCATPEERSHAAARGVELIVLDQSGADGPMGTHRAHELVALAKGTTDRHVAWWIGHDVISGALARRAADLVQGSRCAIFHHMNYEAYKGLSGASKGTRQKIGEQRQVLTSADVVLAVGPKLARSAQEKTSSSARVQVVQVIPGLSDVRSLPQPVIFSAITFGRLTPDTDLIKQARLAVEAFASATDVPYSPLGPDARITVLGLSGDSADEEHKALLELASRRANRAVPVNAFPYSDDRESLLDELRRHSVCLMLSLHEGFGLTGWEAIAAEVPLIVSKNSGLFETIDNLLGGQGLGCIEAVEVRGRIGDGPFQEEDRKAVLDALLRVAINPARAKRNAVTLKSLLSASCTWKNAAQTVACACGLHAKLLPTARDPDENSREGRSLTEKPETESNVEDLVLEAKEEQRRLFIEEKRREAEQRRRLQLDGIPYPRDVRFFRGREREIAQIIAALRDRRSLQVQSYLYGMGGVGKTALAVEICYRLIDEQVFQDGVLWYRVQLEDAAEVVRECARALKLGSKLEQPAGADRVLEFQELIRAMDILVVLDNADYSLDIIQPLLHLFRGKALLITSRNELDLPGALTIRLGGMEPPEAVELLKALLAQRERSVPEAWSRYGEEMDLRLLARTVGYLPLALKLAAYHMLQKRLTVSEYLERWRSQRSPLSLVRARLPEKEERLCDVRACFSLSYETLTVQAKRLLQHLGQWEGRELALRHLRQTLDEVFHPTTRGHDGTVTAIVETADGAYVFTGGEDGRVLMWPREPSPVPPMTVLQMAAPVSSLLPPERKMPLVAADDDQVVAIVQLDCANALIGESTWWRINGPWKIAQLAGGAPAVEVALEFNHIRVPFVGDEAEILPLTDPCAPSQVPAARLASWLADRAMHWRPQANHGGDAKVPPDGWLDGVAETVVDPSSVRPVRKDDRDWVLTKTRPPEEAARSENDGLKDLVIGQLVAPSLAEDRMGPSGEIRLRLHPLVSEFANELQPLSARETLRGKVQRFYVREVAKNAGLIDTDEDNVSAACNWMVACGDSDHLLSGDSIGLTSALQQRGRWRLLVHLYDARIRAAEAVGKTRKAAELEVRRAYLLRHVDPAGLGSRLRDLQRRLEVAIRHEPLDSADSVGLALYEDLYWSGVMPGQAEREKALRTARDSGVDGASIAWWLSSWLDRPEVGEVLDEMAASSSDDTDRARYKVNAASCRTVEERLRTEQEVIDTAARLRNEELMAFVLFDHVTSLIASGADQPARKWIDDYRALAELRGSEMANASCIEWEALLDARQGRAADALEKARRARAFWSFGNEGAEIPNFCNIVHLLVAVADWRGVEEMLERLRGAWPSAGLTSRWAYHAASVALLIEHGRAGDAALAWARAEAYGEAIASPVTKMYHRELAAAGNQLVLQEEEQALARQIVWGNPGAPRVMAQVPGFAEKTSRLLLPSHMRWEAVTVGEVRKFCGSAGERQLPWYYLEFHADAGDEEPARFLDYGLSAAIADWLGEELPAAARWRGLPRHEAWTPQPPSREPTLGRPTGRIDEWAAGQDVYSKVLSALVERLNGDARKVGCQVLLSDALGPVDKWRLLERMTGGMSALDNRTRALLAAALPASVPSLLTPGVCRRLILDWRSIGFLAGLWDAPPSGLWLRPEFVARPKTFGALPHLGVVGSLHRTDKPRGMVMVPGRYAWADVMAWPCTVLDPSPYTEEAPPWP